MSQGIFSPSGVTYILDYADDSTDTSTEVAAASAVSIFNPDAANIVAVSFGFATDGDNNAFLPVGGDPGEGVIVGPGQQLTVNLPQAAYINTNTMLVAVAGASATGNVYISLGSLQ
jgi:hypothetical protein